ncbi:putative poly(beta-D-mannuronate) O-acetylase [Lunatimonas lonarensis]|uniref:Putative poly(Beta-D-mannuronate) O-acetylase n=1 Tax=Lunatimonas lonarensis TaxID=1232681 RepID=R7ZW13_9BACT|nr:MBOAT family O-acyltransferase [Lunatimonas lonarensis]EON78277.1 putative poly(beta-D-mannuronate) O-acetylase [Lunatimonas lonarensis]
MLFNSFEFIFGFLPLVVFGFYVVSRFSTGQGGRIWLFFSSLFFYGWWNPLYVVLILGSMFVNYVLGTFLSKSNGSKGVLVVGVTFNLLLLGYYKFVDFFIENINLIPGVSFTYLNVVLPLGISFFTFQQIAYLVDSYRGLTKELNPISYGVFVSFFPQLIAGPIVHHKEMMPQFDSAGTYRASFFNLSKGAYVFMLGLAKKTVVADNLAPVVAAGYSSVDTLSFLDAWVATLFYAMQLYFDFSGYSDMAIGLALLFNVNIPLNFDSPYKSANIQEFWRRWHMTLSRFLRDYLYIPLGGSRKGPLITSVNLVLTFLLGGIWHGAGWTFVVWGLLHGFGIVAFRLWDRLGIKLPVFLSVLITFFFVNFAWVFFRAESMEAAITMVSKMVQFGSIGKLKVIDNWQNAPLWLIGFVLLFVPNTNRFASWFRTDWLHLLLLVLLFVINLMFLNSVVQREFLYFNF